MKKFLLVGLLVVVALAGTIGGVTLAQDDEEATTTTTTSPMMERVAQILGIEVATLENAFTQVRSELRIEARDNFLQNLVEEGVITQEQADEYGAWLDTRPDIDIGPRIQARIGDGSGMFKFGFGGGMRGFGAGFGGFGGNCPQGTE